MNIQVLLVDDHAVLRKGLRLLLEEEEDLTVVGEAGDGQEAIELFRKLSPDVVVMDITMKGLNGIEATRHIIAESPTTKVLALSIHSGGRFVENMLDAGVSGYLLKDSAPEELVEGIRAVVRGEVYLSTAITEVVVSRLRQRQSTAGLDVHDDAELAEAAGDLGLLADEVKIQGLPARLGDPDAATTPLRSTKLHRPPIVADHIHRPRLQESLEKSRDLPFTLISAPAGYGKSTLVSYWVSTCDLPAAWVSLDEDENDLRQFLHYFLAAVGSLFPTALEETHSLADAAILPPLSVLAKALTNDLDWIEKDFVLVLDDFHRIRSEPVHSLIAELLRYPPRPLHLVVITRYDPSLPMTRLRADGRMNELRTRDLRFTGPEVTALLERVIGLTVGDDTLARLEEQLEGWVVGLRLVALALGYVNSPEKLLEGMSGGIPQIQEYLLQEVLAQRSPQIQDWLLKTSILDRFCMQLCSAVCKAEATPGSSDLDGIQFIDALQRCNLFIIPLDNEGKWFRYHHLFQELLSDQLQLRMGPDEIATLHLRASEWFEAEDLVDEALEHALSAEAVERAAQMVERKLRPMMNEARWYIIETWMSRLPEAEILSRPELLLGRAYICFYRWNTAEIPLILDRIDDLMDEDPETHSLSAEVAVFRGVCAFFGADGARSMEYLERAHDQIPGRNTELHAINEVFLLMAGQMEGQEERVRAAAVTWIGDEKTQFHVLRKAHVQTALRHLDLTSGHLEAIKLGIPKERELARTHNLDDMVAWCDYHVGMSHLYQGDLDAAIRFLEAAGKRKYFHYAMSAVDALAGLTIAYQANGQPRQATASLQSLREFVREVHPFFTIFAESCATRLQIMQGRSEPVVWWPGPSAGDPVQPMTLYFEIPSLTRCRAIIAQGNAEDLAKVQEQLQSYVEMNEVHHNTLKLIELNTLQAVAFDKQDRPEEALTTLERALELAQPGGFIFPFLEPGLPMARLLRRLPEGEPHTAYVQRILSAFGESEQKMAANAGRGQVVGQVASQLAGQVVSEELPELLTDRELDVLMLLARRLQDKEIAVQLCVSAQTVNSHCKNIYQKLYVSNRRQAVVKGINLGILHGEQPAD